MDKSNFERSERARLQLAGLDHSAKDMKMVYAPDWKPNKKEKWTGNVKKNMKISKICRGGTTG